MDPISKLEAFSTFMTEGGAFMWIILFCWCFGLAIAIERFMSYFIYDSNGESLMREVRKRVLDNNIHEALILCSKSKALLPRVMKNVLKRANQTREVLSDAVESTILEVIPKVEKRLSYLALVANISTLIGLLGTIYGLIESFSAVAGADPAEKSKLLALGISKAMNTTALGLISAISIMVLHSILTTKSEKIISDTMEYSTKLVEIIGAKKSVAREVYQQEGHSLGNHDSLDGDEHKEEGPPLPAG